jgi:acid stress chaperone HdeB
VQRRGLLEAGMAAVVRRLRLYRCSEDEPTEPGQPLIFVRRFFKVAATLGSRSMKNRKTALLGLLLALLTSMPVNAQVRLDVSKITCEQFWLRKVADPDKVALWISGYINGKRGNTVIDTQQLKGNVRKLTEYCRENYQMTVMLAVETLMNQKKIP